MVSFEVLAEDDTVRTDMLTLVLDGEELGRASFAPQGIGKRQQATFQWVWNTAGFDPGIYCLEFYVAGGVAWQEMVRLLPSRYVPPPEPEASWQSTSSACCSLHYISGTDAERDIQLLAEQADEVSATVSGQLGVQLTEKIPITFIPRVIGQGGFAWDGLYLTYLDESYLGNELNIILHHEFVHYYDDALGGDYTPPILVEGLAVYLSGGHYKPEAIIPRAAGLLVLNWYIPLNTLANDFYTHQHEIGYLEAGAFVSYLHETYGPGTFAEFYRTIPPPGDGGDSGSLDRALQETYGKTLDEIEQDFILTLARQVVAPDILRDLELTVMTYETLRRYQADFDPSAYFLTAWLPDGNEMRRRGLVADFTRRPQDWQNRLVETMLMGLHERLFISDLEAASRRITWTNWILDVLEP